ncbi:IS5 family transposase [Streptomyces sp. NPDC002870]|uniref:IS5 family transposase n=1 Tax=Streptomyces sp. NPDC002870 TaxID=3364666 RepID=UPI0036A09EAC
MDHGRVRRHELTDIEWELLAPLIPRAGTGRPRVDDRRILNGMVYKIRTGVTWRDLPERYGPWKTVYTRFRRYALEGVFTRALQQIQAQAEAVGDIDWLVQIDSTIVRAHQHAAATGRKGGGTGGRNRREEPDDHALGRSRGGLTSKIHLACDGRGRPLAILLTPGQRYLGSPYGVRLVDRTNSGVFAVRSSFCSPLTPRSYGMDRLRWFRFLWVLGIQPVAATRQEGDVCGVVGDPQATGREEVVEGQQSVKERVECAGRMRRAVAVGVDVVAASDAHHRRPDLGGGEPAAKRQEAERLDLGDRPEVEAVRYVYLQDGLHHDRPAKCCASRARITSRLRRAPSSRPWELSLFACTALSRCVPCCSLSPAPGALYRILKNGSP